MVVGLGIYFIVDNMLKKEVGFFELINVKELVYDISMGKVEIKLVFINVIQLVVIGKND